MPEHQDDAHDGARQEGDRESGDHETAEEEAHHARELHVAHPHPSRVDERGDEEEDESAGAGYEQLGQDVGPEGDGGDQPVDRRRGDDPVGHDLVLEVDEADGDQRRREGDQRDQLGMEPTREHHAYEAERREQLDRGVARRDRLAAVPAASLEEQPGEQRHVVARCHRRLAVRTARARPDERLPDREPVHHDIEEGADDGARDASEGGFHRAIRFFVR